MLERAVVECQETRARCKSNSAEILALLESALLYRCDTGRYFHFLEPRLPEAHLWNIIKQLDSTTVFSARHFPKACFPSFLTLFGIAISVSPLL